MKKILTLIILISLITSLVACGVSKEETHNLQITSDTDMVFDETLPESMEKENEFSIGTITGKTYENEFLCVGCTLPDEWVFHSEEQIKELNNATVDLMPDEYKELIEQSDLVYDMMANTEDHNSSINVILEKSNITYVATFNLETDYEAIAEITKSSFEDIGFTDINYSILTTDFAGEEIECLMWDMKMGKENIYEIQVFIKAFDYIGTITVASTDLSTCKDILSSFYKL